MRCARKVAICLAIFLVCGAGWIGIAQSAEASAGARPAAKDAVHVLTSDLPVVAFKSVSNVWVPYYDNRWRYRFYNGTWWYWLPSNRWAYYADGAWVVYYPATYYVYPPAYVYPRTYAVYPRTYVTPYWADRYGAGYRGYYRRPYIR